MIVPYSVETIYEKWADAVKPFVGDNFSMDNTQVLVTIPAATLFFMGFPTTSSSLTGDEMTTSPTIQVDVYADGANALTKVYKIDEASHSLLAGKLGFQRRFGPELTPSQNNGIKRLTSRYSRTLSSGDINITGCQQTVADR